MGDKDWWPDNRNIAYDWVNLDPQYIVTFAPGVVATLIPTRTVE